MENQVGIDFDAIENDNEGEVFKEENVTEDEINDDIETSSEPLIYKNRLEKFVREIAEAEELPTIQISAEGWTRLQDLSEFLISIIIFETIDQLKKEGKKKVMPKHLDIALDRFLDNSSAVDIAISLLSENIEKLNSLNKSSAIGRATKFIND